MNFTAGQKVDLEKIHQVMVSQPEQEVFQFVWKIKRFALPLKTEKLMSPVFTSPTGKTEWIVNIWNGPKVSNAQSSYSQNYIYIGLQLATTQSDFPITATYSYTFLNSKMMVEKVTYGSSHPFMGIGELHENLGQSLHSGNLSRGYYQPPCYLTSDGSLNLAFSVTITTPRHNEEGVKVEKSERLVPVMTSQASLQSFLDNGEFADMTLSTKTKSFPASKIILAAGSPAFKAMFLSEMRESKENVVKIEDFSDETVKGFLEFLYTGQSDSLKENAVELLKMGDKYQVEPLKNECEKVLMKNLDKEKAADLLILAHFYNSPELKSKVIAFVKKCRKDVANTESFKQLKKHHPEILLDLYSELD